jgi:hypothetical protein
MYLETYYLPLYIFYELEWCSRYSDYSMGYETEELRFNSSKKREAFLYYKAPRQALGIEEVIFSGG